MQKNGYQYIFDPFHHSKGKNQSGRQGSYLGSNHDQQTDGAHLDPAIRSSAAMAALKNTGVSPDDLFKFNPGLYKMALAADMEIKYVDFQK